MLVGEEGRRLGVRPKTFVGENIRVGKRGDDDVQGLAAVWRFVARVLHPKGRQRRPPIVSSSVERGRTSRNLPPLMRGSNQPWYPAEDLSVMIVWPLPAAGCAVARTREENSRDSGRSIFRELEGGKARKSEGAQSDRQRWSYTSETDCPATGEIDETSRRPSPPLLTANAGISCLMNAFRSRETR